MTTSDDFNGNPTTYGYDSFGRLTSIVRPGDSMSFPTNSYDYVMADPERGVVYRYDLHGNLTSAPEPPTASSVTKHSREDAGAAGTFDAIRYVDGLGRDLAHVEESETGFVVKDAVRFNARGSVRDRLQPYEPTQPDYTMPDSGRTLSYPDGDRVTSAYNQRSGAFR